MKVLNIIIIFIFIKNIHTISIDKLNDINSKDKFNLNDLVFKKECNVHLLNHDLNTMIHSEANCYINGTSCGEINICNNLISSTKISTNNCAEQMKEIYEKLFIYINTGKTNMTNSEFFKYIANPKNINIKKIMERNKIYGNLLKNINKYTTKFFLFGGTINEGCQTNLSEIQKLFLNKCNYRFNFRNEYYEKINSLKEKGLECSNKESKILSCYEKCMINGPSEFRANVISFTYNKNTNHKDLNCCLECNNSNQCDTYFKSS